MSPVSDDTANGPDSPADIPASLTVNPPFTEEARPGETGDPEDPLSAMERLIAAGERTGALAHARETASAREAEWWSAGLVASLAHCVIDLGEPGEAATLIEALLEEGRASARALTVLARARTLEGRHAEALEALNEASHLDGRSAEVLLALGAARMAAGDTARAIAELERVLRISTGENAQQADERAEAHFRLGEAWASLDEPERAARHFRSSQGEDASDRRGAGIRLAELEAQPAPTKASAAYVRALFDGYAPRYDGHMVETLAYRGPALLREAADRAGVPAGAPHDAIDLGCGTGLSGAAFNDICRTMLGVDLSPRMCAAAETSGFYSRVIAGELVATLDAEAAPFSFAIACDTVIYLGDLAPLFTSLAAKLATGGWFVFSTEKSDGVSEEAALRGFEVGPTRRFRHTESYLRWLGSRFGFALVSLDTGMLRTEKRAPVESFICVMRKM
ncbi:methyltransferase domain-containing protein [Parvibaculum sp.]|uniref:methyltransferase domain-containing protein n=1 Tax=Parvibaculum sp. TaxID=2024848 RepID=UPI003BA9B21F